MRPSHRLPAKALTVVVLAGVLACSVAEANYYQPVVRSLGLASDVARSPRLVGMGGLSLVVPDRYNDITLWDFAGSPIGAATADSVSSLDLRPGSGSAEGAYNPQPGLMRESFAGRSTVFPMEAFYRDRKGNATGVVGRLGSVHADAPFDQGLELRRSVSDPEVMPIIAGPFPYWGKGKLLGAVRLLFGRETRTDQARQYVRNAAGEFLSLEGVAIRTSDLFMPLDYEVRTAGAGAALAYPLPGSTWLALGADYRGERFDSSNDRSRSLSQIEEHRPTTTGQASLIGRLGRSLQYGVDGRAWRANSEQRWMFTISSGSGVTPLSGRGNLLRRNAEGTSLRSRARWTAGAFELGGQAWTRWSRVRIKPPKQGDATTLNLFLTRIYYQVGADSLMLPDSVLANEINEHSFGLAGGASWKFRRGIAGVEYHWARSAFDQAVAGAGPKPLEWTVRGGLEYACSPMVDARVGGGLGWNDEDDYTAGNEWTSRFATLGLGIHPARATWSFDVGYSLTWAQADYGDPTEHRASRQQFQSLVHWGF